MSLPLVGEHSLLCVLLRDRAGGTWLLVADGVSCVGTWISSPEPRFPLFHSRQTCVLHTGHCCTVWTAMQVLSVGEDWCTGLVPLSPNGAELPVSTKRSANKHIYKMWRRSQRSAEQIHPASWPCELCHFGHRVLNVRCEPWIDSRV